MISTAYREACVEVLAILDNTPYEDKKNIPQKFVEFLKENASKTYQISFESDKEIKDLNLKKETKSLLSVIYYNYLCPDNKKQEYVELLKSNKNKYEEEIREKYNPDNIFKNDITYKEHSVSNELALTKYKENIITKIINKIKAFFCGSSGSWRAAKEKVFTEHFSNPPFRLSLCQTTNKKTHNLRYAFFIWWVIGESNPGPSD